MSWWWDDLKNEAHQSVDDKLAEIQSNYYERIAESNARIARILDKLENPGPTLTVDAPARVRYGRRKSDWVQPSKVHVGLTIQLTYIFPITKSVYYEDVEVRILDKRRIKRLDVGAVLISGDTLQVVYSLVPSSLANAAYQVVDSVRII